MKLIKEQVSKIKVVGNKTITNINKNIINVLNDFATKKNITINIDFNPNNIEYKNGNGIYVTNITNIEDLRKFLVENQFKEVTSLTQNPNELKYFKVVSSTQIYICNVEKPQASSTQTNTNFSTGRTNMSTNPDVFSKYGSGRTNMSTTPDVMSKGRVGENYFITKSKILHLFETTTSIFNAPVPNFSENLISSSFDETGAKEGRKHSGIDIAIASGTNVLAPMDGTVISSRDTTDGCGGLISIKHSEVLFTRYCHIKSRKVNEGDAVKAGAVIGLSGGGENDEYKGNSTGPHLHFEVIDNGKNVDPINFINGSYNANNDSKQSGVFSAKTNMATNPTLQLTSIANRLNIIIEAPEPTRNEIIASKIYKLGDGEKIGEYKYVIDANGVEKKLKSTFDTCEKRRYSTSTEYRCTINPDIEFNLKIGGELNDSKSNVALGEVIGKYKDKLTFTAYIGFTNIPINGTEAKKSRSDAKLISGKTNMATKPDVKSYSSSNSAKGKSNFDIDTMKSNIALIPSKTSGASRLDIKKIDENINKIKKLMI
jgi:murein DD-endopeptidase MepM/ murein hydrolase activator NlpD